MLITDMANKIIVKYFIWYFLNDVSAFSEKRKNKKKKEARLV